MLSVKCESGYDHYTSGKYELGLVVGMRTCFVERVVASFGLLSRF